MYLFPHLCTELAARNNKYYICGALHDGGAKLNFIAIGGII